MRRTDEARESESFGSGVMLEVAVALNGLEASDVRIECLASLPNAPLALGDREVLRFAPYGAPENGEQRYRLDLRPKYCGLLTYEIRAYPYHEALTHPFETGLMLYL